MTLFETMGLISTIALALPILTICIFKLAWYRSFPALLGYYILLFSYNLIFLDYIKVSASFSDYHVIANDLLSTPLVLFFLTYFCSTNSSRRNLHFIIYAFLAFEVLALILWGFTTRSSKITTVPGLALSLGAILYFFIPQLKLTILYHKGFARALILSSLFFATMGFGYTFSIVNFVDIRFTSDAQLVFFLISILSAISVSIGLFYEQKRIRQLEELKTTREELKALYGEEEDEKKTAPFGTVALNFDKEQWN